VGDPRVDLDRNPAVHPVGSFPHRLEHIARRAHVVGRGGAHGGVDVGIAFGQLGDLVVVGLAVRQRLLENAGVAGDADDRLGVDEFLQVAGLDPVPRQVVQPYGYARCAQRREVGILSHE
jgi:hypothetical protein